MTTDDTLHPFDAATTIAQQAEGRYAGAAHPAWHNMVGPFGGITAATALNAVMQHPKLLGQPVSMTSNYASAVKDAPFEVFVQPVRTNRATQHWTIAITQADDAGQPETVFTATAVTAVRRETWGATDNLMPTVPGPDQYERVVFDKFPWVARYDMRAVHGAVPTKWDDSGEASLSQLWLRDHPERPLDLLSLAAIADAFYPRAWLRRARVVPAGTVSFTTYFHADDTVLARTGSGWLLGQAQAQRFFNGFADQTAQIWNEAGDLLVTTHQLAYYKE